MILLKRITLLNFLSHERTEINFGQNEKVLMDGASGAGKSSIFDGIIWALYGQGRAENRMLVKKGAKKGSVCLELTRRDEQTGEEDTVVITRSATPNGKHTLDISNYYDDGTRMAHPLTGIKELQNWIDRSLIGASYLLFINSVAYVQGSTENFVSQTAPKRKELLLEILKAEDYDKYYEKARQTLVELSNDHNRGNGQLTEIEATLTRLRTNLGDRGAQVKTINDGQTMLLELDTQISTLEKQKEAYIGLYQTVTVLDGVLKSKERDIEDVQKTISFKRSKLLDKEILENKVKDIPRLKEEIKKASDKLDTFRNCFETFVKQEEKRKEIFNRKPNINDRTGEINRLNENIAKIAAKPICPSGTLCPYSGDHEEQINAFKSQIKACEDLTVKETIAFTEWSEEIKKLPETIDTKILVNDIKKEGENLSQTNNELTISQKAENDLKLIQQIEEEIVDLDKSLVSKKEQAEDAKKKKEEAEQSFKSDELDKINKELFAVRDKQKNLNTEIARASETLNSIARDEEEIKNSEKKIVILKDAVAMVDEKIRKISIVKDAFGSKGLKTLVIDYLLPKLEDRINEILSKLSDFRIRLDTQKKSADGENTIEGLYIFVYNELGEEMDFNNYSGGEKLRITIAIAEALASLHKNIGFRIMDEVIFGLSSEMVQDFIAVLDDLQQKHPQILCISHLLEVKSVFEKTLMVKKHNGVSFIEN